MKSRWLWSIGFVLVTWLWIGPAFSQNQPETPMELNNKGVADHNAGRFQEAVDKYSRAIQLNPQYGLGYFNRGISYFALNQLDRMCQDFAKACELGYCEGLIMAKDDGFCADVPMPTAGSTVTQPAPPPRPPLPKPTVRKRPTLKQPTVASQAPQLPGMPILIAIGVFTILFLVSGWIVYRKADQPGWGFLIPIYNLILFVRIAGKPMWWFPIILLVPVLNAVFYFLACLSFAKKFDKGLVFGLGLFLLPIVFFPLLAFTKAEYIG